jgi:hypothetical protein
VSVPLTLYFWVEDGEWVLYYLKTPGVTNGRVDLLLIMLVSRVQPAIIAKLGTAVEV